MRDTYPVRGVLRLIVCSVALGSTLVSPETGRAPTWAGAVAETGRVNPEARLVVVDIESGRIVAAQNMKDAARTLAAPGSTLKPLVLYALVQARRWNQDRRIACDRRLVVAGHHLDCTHPAAPSFNAREALAWSCNSYFAAVARTLQQGELGRMLRPTELLGATGFAANEAIAEFKDPRTPEEEELAVLGTEGIRVTPLELAAAYRWLAMQMAAEPDAESTRLVSAGLADSASFGMAGQASAGGVAVAGKTGTAEGEKTMQTHGWFAGLFPAQRPRVVVVVYLPAGRGADAAHLAGVMLSHAPEKQP